MIQGDKSVYPGTDVLVNKFGVRDSEIAKAIEYKFASVRELELSESPIRGKFDVRHLQKIHKHIFQDVYEWAGQFREVDFAKKNSKTGLINKFTPKIVLDLKIEDFDRLIKDKNQLKNLNKSEFVDHLAVIHSKLNELHPFREGNGRSTRIFLSQLSREAGFELNLEKIDKDRWNFASHVAQVQYSTRNPDIRKKGDLSEIRKIFEESITPTIGHAFLHERRENALELYPSLQSSFNRIDQIQKFVSENLGSAGERVIELEKRRISNKLDQKEDVLSNGNYKQDVAKVVLSEVLKQRGYSDQAVSKIVSHVDISKQSDISVEK